MAMVLYRPRRAYPTGQVTQKGALLFYRLLFGFHLEEVREADAERYGKSCVSTKQVTTWEMSQLLCRRGQAAESRSDSATHRP